MTDASTDIPHLNPLLTAELHIPHPRLIKRVNRGLQRKATLISAPAGFGKTVLEGVGKPRTCVLG